MSGSRWVPGGLAILAIVFGASAAKAQGSDGVPGGWEPQVGFQSFNGPGEDRDRNGGGSAFEAPAFGPLSPWTVFGGPGLMRTVPLTPQFDSRPQTVNNLMPFADSVRKNGRKRSRR